jgi:hypothetical protein
VVDHPTSAFHLSVDVCPPSAGLREEEEEDHHLSGAVQVPGREEAGAMRGHRDDDCESGHGPSLPMSPHSGATGGPHKGKVLVFAVLWSWQLFIPDPAFQINNLWKFLTYVVL